MSSERVGVGAGAVDGEGVAADRFAGLPPVLPHVPFERYEPGVPAEAAAKRFYDVLQRRRSVRTFAPHPVSRETIEWCVRAAGTAPSGAHKQPWRFVCINDASLKRRIREAAEAEEREFYERRASRRWLEDLAPLGTDHSKPFLEIAPWLIVVMQLSKTDDGGMVYYREESVGLATGMLISAIHHAGLVTLTHTPSPMKFLTEVLGRPSHERPFVLLPVGYPAADAEVPDLSRKPLHEIMTLNAGAQTASEQTAGE
jgi:nitroreductase